MCETLDTAGGVRLEARFGRAAMPRAHRCGFTLVEAVVTIGIIILLTGLTVAAVTSVMRQTEIRQTESTLALLDAAMQEWESNAGRKLTWKAHYDPDHIVAEVHWNTPEVLIVSEVLDVVQRDPAARSILSRIDPEFLFEFSRDSIPRWISPDEQNEVYERFIGSLTVVDAWGAPIYATHSGRAHDLRTFDFDVNRDPDPDGTIRTYNEAKYGIARNRRVCFVSAGPDGQFGFQSAPPESPDFKATLDNLYSYPPQRPDPH